MIIESLASRSGGNAPLFFEEPRVSNIKQQREKNEKRAQYIFPLRNPGCGFDMQWMNSEKRRNKGASPHCSSQHFEKKKYEHSVSAMQKHVGYMKAESVGSGQFGVQH